MEEVAAVGGSGHWEAIEEEDLAGVPSQSPIDSGCVSQSLSAYSGTFASLLTEEPQDLEQLIKSTSTNFSSYLLPDHSGNAEIQDLDKSLEDLLIRVDEFVGMLDMIRNDTSQVVNERIPQIHTKAAEMRHLYKKIDLLEKQTPARSQHSRYEPPSVFKTDDFFPSSS
ncbi:hypothetical protein XENTR_v10016722 [Xenopus tropicalis]|nr:hypothetical protein XENTR_v10016722 [Xenopus tropicalis]